VANAPKKTAPAWLPKPLPNSTQKNRRCGIVRLLVGKAVAEPGSPTNPLVNASSVVARLLLLLLLARLRAKCLLKNVRLLWNARCAKKMTALLLLANLHSVPIARLLRVVRRLRVSAR
jgi:hypothetical protein